MVSLQGQKYSQLTREGHLHDSGLGVTQLRVSCYRVGAAWWHWWWTFLKVNIFVIDKHKFSKRVHIKIAWL